MNRKRLSVLGFLALGGLALGLLAFSAPALTQDYIDPSQTQDAAPDDQPSGHSVKPVETEYEKRLREEIERQLEAQKNGTEGDTAADTSTPGDEAEDDFTFEEEEKPIIAQCSTLAKAVTSIAEAAASANPDDKTILSKAGQKLNAIIRATSQGFDNLPSSLECSIGGGTSVKDMSDEAKAMFEKKFKQDCQKIAEEAKESIAKGGIGGFNNYIEAKLDSLSQISVNDAVIEKCNSGDTIVQDTQPPSTPGGIVGGSGSGGGGMNNDQSYPPNYEPGGHEHAASGNGRANETPFQSSATPIPESHNNDPPGMTFPPGARRLKIRFDARQYGQDDRYKNCVFHDGTSPVLACKEQLDWVLRDVLGKNKGLVASMDMGMYHSIYDVCKALKNGACEDGGNTYAIVASAYRGPGTQEIVNPGVSANSSCHPKAKSTDLNFPGASAAKVNSTCDSLDRGGSNTVIGCGKYSGFTEINSCNKSWTKYGNPKA